MVIRYALWLVVDRCGLGNDSVLLPKADQSSIHLFNRIIQLPIVSDLMKGLDHVATGRCVVCVCDVIKIFLKSFVCRCNFVGLYCIHLMT